VPDASYFFECLQRLGSGEWFTSRVSACGIIATVYKRSDLSKRLDLRNLYKDLTHDETPMVRRAAAQNLGKLATVMDSSDVSKDIIPIFHDLTQDGKCS
jgi:serine/threonine-protein phosphatase 2A regulatory subunit A